MSHCQQNSAKIISLCGQTAAAGNAQVRNEPCLPHALLPNKRAGKRRWKESTLQTLLCTYIRRVTHARRSNFQVQLASSVHSHKLAVFLHLLFKMLQILAWKWGR